jgi:deoxyribodipyrimidine photo-lyase
MSSASLVWFRQDLRAHDNPALSAALARKAPVAALYVLDDETPGRWKKGGASRWWLHHSLEALEKKLATLGVPLLLRRGRAAAVLPAIAAEIEAGAVYWNRCYEPYAIARDTGLKAALGQSGCAVHSFNAALLYEPWQVTNKSGGFFKVYSPFWRAARAQGQPAPPLPSPHAQTPYAASTSSDALASWRLLPSAPDWAGGLRAAWVPGEDGALARAAAFFQTGLAGYAELRNRPDLAHVSGLSPHLHFGEISPRQVWQAALMAGESGQASPRDVDKFHSELGWREFAYHLLYHFPALPDAPFQPRFADFPWAENETALAAWRRGSTGYPIVDAGMRQLWETGWMHNRVRMVVASFLIKHLLIDWRLGQDWFWDTLCDADLANNAASWQWVAGSGADAAPYFRIFNPVLQGEKFDPDGAYVRRFVPELARLPNAVLHRPWEAPRETLAKAGVILGQTYPQPIVEHAAARARALAALERLPKP